MPAISAWCSQLPTSNIGSGFKWAPPADTGGKLKIDPHSDLAILKDLAEKLISLADEAYRTGPGDLESGGDSGYGMPGPSQGTPGDQIKEVGDADSEAVIYL